MEGATFWCDHETCQKYVTVPTKTGQVTVADHIDFHNYVDKYAMEFWELWNEIHKKAE